MKQLSNDWRIPVIGLTGSIASGKSLAARMLEDMGARVIDADRLQRVVTARGRVAFRMIVEAFGEGILDGKGRIDRAALGGLVFRDREKKRILESITHAEIMKAADRRIRRVAAREFKPLFLEAALLIEAGLHHFLDGLVVVVADESVQAGRMKKNRKMSDEEIRLRLKAQMSSKRKAGAADWLIDNNGTKSRLRARVGKVLGEIRKSRVYTIKKKNWKPAIKL